MVKSLNIPMESYNGEGKKPEEFDYFIFVDHQGARSPWYQSKKIKNDQILGIIDHHTDTKKRTPKCMFKDIRTVGSSSAIGAEYFLNGAEEHFEDAEKSRICTALFYGIVTDTDHLMKEATEFDANMHYELISRANLDIVHSCLKPEMSKKWMDYLGRAIVGRETRDGTTVASVGVIAEEDRDAIAMTADRLLIEMNVDKSYVIGIRPDIIDVCIRTSDLAYDFAQLQELFPEGQGGGKKTAGGIQIPNQFRDNTFIKFEKANYATIEDTVLKEFKKRIFSQNEIEAKKEK